MFTVVVANHKGGVGKTTLTGHLAVQCDVSGDGPSGLIDLDPQGSLADWVNQRRPETPVFLDPTALGGLQQTLKKAKASGVGAVFIDTPPSKSNDLAAILALADLVVVPIQASPHDLRAVGATVDLIGKSKRPLVFVLNRVQPRAKLTTQAVVALSQHGTIAPVMVGNRTEFAASMSGGDTIQEISPGSTGALEVAGLWTYLKERMIKHG